MADDRLIMSLLREIEDLKARVQNLEHHEFAFMQTGNGAPTHGAAEGMLYWDYTDTDLYINHNGVDGWGVVVAL